MKSGKIYCSAVVVSGCSGIFRCCRNVEMLLRKMIWRSTASHCGMTVEKLHFSLQLSTAVFQCLRRGCTWHRQRINLGVAAEYPVAAAAGFGK